MNGLKANGAFWSMGECMLELRPGKDNSMTHAAAGDSYNTAVYLKRLVPNLPVRYISALGDDVMSGLIRAHLHAAHLDDELIDTIPGGTPGLYAIETGAGGERRFIYWRSRSAARAMLSPAHLERMREELTGCCTLFITGITLAILDEERRGALLSLAEQVRMAGGWVVLDNNYRAALWTPEAARRWMQRATALCTHALFSYDDEVVLHGDDTPQQSLSRLLRAGVPEVVLKLGASGCLVQAGTDEAVQVPAQKASAVDTTAAGDSFNAGYLASRLAGASYLEAARMGSALAAAVVQHPGAIIPRDAMPANIHVPAWG